MDGGDGWIAVALWVAHASLNIAFGADLHLCGRGLGWRERTGKMTPTPTPSPSHGWLTRSALCLRLLTPTSSGLQQNRLPAPTLTSISTQKWTTSNNR